jgi:F0F1-type ATP synthase membrane subunit c/vacuolar-type H+-ATPase subunit K
MQWSKNQAAKTSIADYLRIIALSSGLAIGAGIGAAIGSIGAGVGIGMAIGVAVELVLYRRFKSNCSDN